MGRSKLMTPLTALTTSAVATTTILLNLEYAIRKWQKCEVDEIRENDEVDCKVATEKKKQKTKRIYSKKNVLA